MKKTTFLTLILIMQLLTLSITPATTTTTNTVDIPTWTKNDSWTYTIDPIIYTSPNGSFTGSITNFKQTLATIETINTHTIYNLTITGTITGDLTYEGLSGQLTGTILGYTQIRQADLAELTTHIHSTGTIKIYFINQPYTLTSHTTFTTPFELYDFPLTPTEHWNTTTYSTSTNTFTISDLINDTYTTTGWINETITCPTQETITTPAGTFTTHQLQHGTTTAWYSPETKNMIKTHIDQSTTNTTLQITMQLTSYTHHTQPTTITTTTTPNPTLLALPITINGTAINTTTSQPLINQPIHLTIPTTQETHTTTTDQQGHYSFTIPTPPITDTTPTTYDIASDGTLIQHPPTNSYHLTTLILRDNTPPTPPTITGKPNGKINTPYTYQFHSTDPEQDTIYYLVDWGDDTTTSWDGPHPADQPISLTHTWTKKDSYTIRCKTKDHFNEESTWTQFEISMPTPTFLSRLQTFLNHFPLIKTLLTNILT